MVEASVIAAQRQRADAARGIRWDVEGPVQKAVENWLPVPGYVGLYDVSDLGRVRSCECFSTYFDNRVGLVTRQRKARIKSPSRSSNGYWGVNLYKLGVSRRFNLHRLVCTAFIGACPEGQEVRHLDGDRTNNRLTNLQFGTKLQNAADREAHGRTYRGPAHGMFKVTDEMVSAVLADRASGLYYYQIAERHGISKAHVCNICKGRRSFMERDDA